MPQSSLQNALQGQKNGTAVREHRGAEVATSFGDPQAEFWALRSGCGVADLGFRTRIRVTGEDRVRWLNGLITNNIRDLAAGHGVYAFLLNPQGRILGDLTAYNRGDSLLVDTDRSQVDTILATFDHYIIMDDVELRNLSEEWTALGIAGPKSQEILKTVGLDVVSLHPLQIRDGNLLGTACMLIRGEDNQPPSYELWLQPDKVRPAWDALIAAGAAPIGSDALEIHRILSGIPLYGVDIRERDLPQETEQARALNFNKGCYVGQEIVERIRSRGNVHRKFTGFVVNGAKVESAAKIIAGEKEVGEITSSASLHTASGEQTFALGYIRREAGIPGREVTIGETRATVAQLPFEIPAISSERELAHR